MDDDLIVLYIYEKNINIDNSCNQRKTFIEKNYINEIKEYKEKEYDEKEYNKEEKEDKEYEKEDKKICQNEDTLHICCGAILSLSLFICLKIF